MVHAQTAHQTIQGISNNLQYHANPSHYGIIGGNAGMTLFRVYMYEMTKDEKYLSLIQQEVESMLDAVNTGIPDYTFAYGLAGVVWFLSEMDRLKIINLADDLPGYITEAREAIVQSIEEDILHENIDFFSGFIGKVVALLPLRNEEEYIAENIFKFFEEKIGNTTDGLYNIKFNDGMPSNNSQYVNLGLAHGLPSILQFCTLCTANNLCKDRAQNLANLIIDFLIETGNTTSADSHYPFYVVKNEVSNSTSRLGWCYGDLSLAFVLYQASLVAMNQPGVNHAIKVIEKTIRRTSVTDADVYDAGICHGSAGLAHMYHKLWRMTDREDFKSAMDHWMDITLAFAKQDGENIFYERYDQKTNSNAPCFNLIEGSTGVGLVLFSYLSNEYNWDVSFLLN